jgi:tetratricopeptide (TPR) repeat protein
MIKDSEQAIDKGMLNGRFPKKRRVLIISTAHDQINPRLISIMTGQEMDKTQEKPTIGMLPGTYPNLIYKNRQSIAPKYRENMKMLCCNLCNRKGKYNIGKILLSPDKMKSMDKNDSETLFDQIQSTGYFRCKHCNQAGSWSPGTSLVTFDIMGGLLRSTFKPENGYDSDSSYIFAEYALFDGFQPHWATDGEEHLLDLLEKDDQDAFVWNRLGNLYFSGHRPELATAAFKKSIEVDSAQMESHFSIAGFLIQINEIERALYHCRQMLLYARYYDRLPAERLRELLAKGLAHGMMAHLDLEKHIPFLPEKEEIDEVSRKMGDSPDIWSEKHLEFVELDLHPDHPESFYPLAEMYMGKQRDHLETSTLPKAKKGSMSMFKEPIDQIAAAAAPLHNHKKVRVKGQMKKKSRKKRKK